MKKKITKAMVESVAKGFPREVVSHTADLAVIKVADFGEVYIERAPELPAEARARTPHLGRAISRCLTHASGDTSRPILARIWAAELHGRRMLVASDGHTLRAERWAGPEGFDTPPFDVLSVLDPVHIKRRPNGGWSLYDGETFTLHLPPPKGEPVKIAHVVPRAVAEESGRSWTVELAPSVSADLVPSLRRLGESGAILCPRNGELHILEERNREALAGVAWSAREATVPADVQIRREFRTCVQAEYLARALDCGDLVIVTTGGDMDPLATIGETGFSVIMPRRM